MAPQRQHVATTVYSSLVRSADETAILVEAGGFRPLRWFLERGSHEEKGDGQPPQKKRKTQSSDQSQQETSKPSEQIPLFEVTIDFHFPETLDNEAVIPEAIETDLIFDEQRSLDVLPCGIETDHHGTRLRLALPHAKGPVLSMECAAVPEAALDLFRSIAFPDQLRVATGHGRKSQHPASTLSCSLNQATGPQPYTVVRLHASLCWQSGVSAFRHGAPVGRRAMYPDYDLLLRAFPDHAREQVDHGQPWTPQDFYESVHVTSNEQDTAGRFANVLESALYPFQKRAVDWMLSREGVQSDGGLISPLSKSAVQKNSVSFVEPVLDSRQVPCYVNHLQGIITGSNPNTGMAQVSGGLLAEEMGLGKTVELIATITLHKRTEELIGKVRDSPSGTAVLRSKATLIITPSAILEQWKTEIARHAPALRVFHYRGLSTTSEHPYIESEGAMLENLAYKYDVVLATYNTLTRELHLAEDPPERYMRHERKFQRPRSPLVQVQWWRICLDEAQMVESGVTAAARVACRLPRVHSWAVSGTPLRKNAQDLFGLLVFLRYRPLSENSKLWGHLITNHKHQFRRIFGQIALRHTKAQIRDELHLPPQKRVVLNLPFSVIEEQNYSTLFAKMCEEIGLTANGAPLSDDWDPEDSTTIEGMRTWLSRLRQTCLHPQVGAKNRKALGRGRGPLRTVAEVLDVMVEQNETGLRLAERNLATCSIERAHVVGNNGEDQHRSEKALEIYNEVMVSTAQMVDDARRHVAVAKTEATAREEKPVDTDDEDSSSESTPLLGRLKTELRTALQLHHVATFFAATSYFQIKSNDALTVPESNQFKVLEEKESSLYEAAKVLRREIMRETSRKAEAMMRSLGQTERTGGFITLPAIKDLPSLGGIESRRIVEKSDKVFDLIREQIKVMITWRAKMAEFLQKPLVDDDDGKETTGEEYEDSTKQQDELYVYFDALKAMQADLNSMITGEYAPLIDHEVKTMIIQAKKLLDPDTPEDQKPFVHAPELALQLLNTRNQFRQRQNHVSSVRGLIQEARVLESSVQAGDSGTRSFSERQLVQRLLAALQDIFTAYTKALAGLEKELGLFRTLQNHRVQFYKQLQELSDAVAPYRDGQLDTTLDQHQLRSVMSREERHRTALAKHRTKGRFLLNLRDESGVQEGPKICVICQNHFEQGVLTVCGHQYCRECIQHWFTQAKTCPICKRRLNNFDLHDITYKPQELRAQEEVQPNLSSSSKPAAGSPTAPGLHTSIYSDVDSELMVEIKSIDLPKSYGVKIDTLGRHLHWIREHDPGAKSIVFSQYREFLDVLGAALTDFKIGAARLGRSGAVEKFRYDAAVDCLLLDAKTDSSGLTLVNATHVFICEPLIQTAVELQAIARVHRIGQTRPTTVWMYLIRDTVEEAIYEVSVARRLAHVQSREQQRRASQSTPMTSGPSRRKVTAESGAATPSGLLQENAIDAANSEELQSAPLTKLLAAGKGGGEMVGQEDLWQCLFGKAQQNGRGNAKAVEMVVERHLRGEAAEQRRREQVA